MAENPIKYSEFIQPDSSITDLIAQLEQLNATYTETLKAIKGEASNAKNSLTGVSGATAQHRDKIKETTVEADKLAKAEKDVAFAQSETARQLALLKKTQADANNINKLTVKLNAAAVGSYNRLSAQYSINKIKLNGMSAEERKASEAGRALETETNAIYQEMKRLQEATGKTTLNVGNYEAATLSLKEELRKNTYALAEMKLAGDDTSKAYQDLLKRTGDLKDAMGDAQNEVKNMASDTSDLDSVLSAAGAAAGGFSVYTGAMEMWGASSEDTAEAQKKLQSAIAITTGIQSIQNAIQKDSAMMMGVAKIQAYALAKAEAYKRLITIQGTSATVGATVAQKVFNAVAAANPYVLLAIALVTVVGALLLFANGTDDAAEKQKKLNEAQRAYLDLLQLESERMNKVGTERVQALEKELALAKARNASSAEVGKIEKDLADQKRKNHNMMVGFYGQEIQDLDKNQQKLYEYRKELIRLQNLKGQGKSKVKVDLELNGNVTKEKIDDAIEAIQGKVDNYGRVVEIATTIKQEKTELDTADAERRAQQVQAAKDAQKTEVDLVRKAEDAKLSLIQNAAIQQRAQTKANYARQIADLQFRLNNENNLTVKARQAINSTIVYLQQKMDQDLIEQANKVAADQRAMLRASQDIELSLMKEGGEKRRAQLNIDYQRQIEDIQTRLETEKGLTIEQRTQLNNDILNLQSQHGVALANLNSSLNIEQLNKEKDLIDMKLQTVQAGSDAEIQLRIQSLQKQRSIELAQNAQMAEDVRQKESDINAKWDALILKESSDFSQQKAMMMFDQQQQLDQSEFDLIRNSEARKTRFKLEAERDRLKKILELNKTASVKMTEAEVKTVENTIAKIGQEIDKSKSDERGKDIYGLFGLNLDDDAKEAINTSVSYAMDAVNTFLQAKVDAADQAVEASQREVEASQKRLDAEVEARNNGYASNVALAQKELDMAKKNEDKALKQKEKALKAQQAIDTITQTSSLITASAQIWASLSAIPVIGVGLALAALGVMWGSFAASKIKAAQMTKKEYGEGGLEFLDGGSHASGNDIGIGTTADGRDRRAEGGEALAIIRKSQTRKYRKLLPGIIDSLNKGTFEQKYLGAYDTGDMSMSMFNTQADLRTLERDVREIKKQGERRYFTDGKGRIIETYKNLRRIYNAN